MELDSLAKLVIGENVWVKHGKTEHMATFLGETRKVTANDSSGDESGSEGGPCKEGEYETLIRWTTTGTTSYVEASSVRPMMDGQRRRRQVTKHYDAVPSQRPGGPKKRKKKTKTQSTEELHNRNGKRDKTSTEMMATKPSSFRSQLQSAEDLERFHKTKKQGTKRSTRKRKRESTNDSHAPFTNDAEASENDSMPSLRRRISESEVSVLIANRKSDDDVEDPSLTIDRGYRWEWETSESKDEQKNSIPQRSISSKLTPKNFGKGKPRCWAEAYSMILDFERNNNEAEGTKCDIPSGHPLLGSFVADIRAEYAMFRKRMKKQKRGYPVPNPDRKCDLNPSKDLTHLTHQRIRQLEKIGFRWRSDSKSHDQSLNTEDDSGSLDDSSGRDLEDDNMQRKSTVSSISSSSSSSSGSNLVSARLQEDHANDDKLLIVRKLSEIKLETLKCRNLLLAQEKMPTFPVQLYRLLRLSALNPKLGLHKFIRWDDDENGFWILQNNSESFMSQVVSKISDWNCVATLWNILRFYNFVYINKHIGIKLGTDGHYRLFKHRSVLEAEKANDPSLRLFYRGVPLKNIWKIQNARDEALGAEEVFKRATPLEGRIITWKESPSSSSGDNATTVKASKEKLIHHSPRAMPLEGKIIRRKDVTSPSSADDTPSLSSENDTTIVKVSKEELGHHSYSILRLLLTNKRKHRRNLRKTQMFQARTKSNPLGIVTKSTNMSNWQKIENLKRRSTQKKTSIDSSFTPAMTNNAFGNEEALV